MAPSALRNSSTELKQYRPKPSSYSHGLVSRAKKHLLNRNTKRSPLLVISGYGNYYVLGGGRAVYDATGGAAVSCIGRYDVRVENAIISQMRLGTAYVPSLGFYTNVTEELAQYLIDSTGGRMSQAVFYGSGSDASEAAMKLAVQYHTKEKHNPELTRTMFIARDRSYHGATLGALDLSGHKSRKSLYSGVLANNVRTVPPCYPYRDQGENETDEAYVQRLTQSLVDQIEEMGPENVAGFIVEPVVGAALGCVSAIPGYLESMRKVCDSYGILLIFDEVMCGLGRTGYLHAWQKWDVAPDIQLVGKGLAGGFQEISGMLVGQKIFKALETGPSGGGFNHGHTFQNHPLACAAALEVQKNIMVNDNLLQNVKDKGQVLEKQLIGRLANHRYVGNVRGLGLFWGIEFVRDKRTKTPFDSKYAINEKLFQKGLEEPYNIHVYPGGGTVDGTHGDHILISPAFNITDEEVKLIVDRVGQLISDFFDEFDASEAPTVPF